MARRAVNLHGCAPRSSYSGGTPGSLFRTGAGRFTSLCPPFFLCGGTPESAFRTGVGRPPPAATPPDPPVACPSSRTLRGTPGSAFHTGAGCAFRAVFPIRCRICETQHLVLIPTQQGSCPPLRPCCVRSFARSGKRTTQGGPRSGGRSCGTGGDPALFDQKSSLGPKNIDKDWEVIAGHVRWSKPGSRDRMPQYELRAAGVPPP